MLLLFFFFFFFNDTATTEIYTLSLHDALPILFIASTTRAERGDSNDTREIVRRLAQLRAQRAQLLGYPSLAAYVLDDQMAKTPDAAIKLLSDLVPAATAQARREAEKLQAMINKQRGGFKLAPWDWQYYAEQVRKAEYALDETQL